MLNLIKILTPLAMPELTYEVPKDMQLAKGDFVTVPLGNKTVNGVVWNERAKDEGYKTKATKEKLDCLPLQENLIKFIDWVADYTLSPKGTVLKMAMSVPKALLPEKKPRKHDELPTSFSHVELSKSQQLAADDLCTKLRANQFSVTLLDGITGSGKTEVYFAAVEELLKKNKINEALSSPLPVPPPQAGEGTSNESSTNSQTLIMLPEIALTTQIITRFEKRFGFKPTQWHSGLTPKQRENNWRDIANGKARLIIGARSALFLPYKNLRLIIIDEEHDASYKQEEGVTYHARDMAVVRASIEKFPVVLASATPSIETVENVKSGKYSHLKLDSRYGDAVLPDIKIVDMRKEKLKAGLWLSSDLKKSIRQNIESGHQSLLFLNRRGYAPLTLCRECGFRFKCPDCSSWLVEHKSAGGRLLCHHCGHTEKIPKQCPECEKEDKLVSCGPGVERIAEEVEASFPDAKISLMTSDNMTTIGKSSTMVEDVTSGNVDIIVGTQMIAKGYHFPKLTLVGVVDADLGLEGGDLRAAERTYQLLQQVSGRAGREKEKGTVFMQSYMPENAVMQSLKSGSRDDFVSTESRSRKETDMPPYSRLAAIIISGKKEQQVLQTAKAIVNTAPKEDSIRVMGPVPAPIFLLRGNYRYRILIKTKRNVNIQKWISRLLSCIKAPSSVRIKVDVDPYSFM